MDYPSTPYLWTTLLLPICLNLSVDYPSTSYLWTTLLLPICLYLSVDYPSTTSTYLFKSIYTLYNTDINHSIGRNAIEKKAFSVILVSNVLNNKKPYLKLLNDFNLLPRKSYDLYVPPPHFLTYPLQIYCILPFPIQFIPPLFSNSRHIKLKCLNFFPEQTFRSRIVSGHTLPEPPLPPPHSPAPPSSKYSTPSWSLTSPSPIPSYHLGVRAGSYSYIQMCSKNNLNSEHLFIFSLFFFRILDFLFRFFLS